MATAIHAGHAMRREALELCALGEEERRREEDPFTERWTAIAGNRLVAHRSRFEVDLNRPRDGAVYLTPDDAWGLEVWKRPPSPGLVAGSLEIYDSFYGQLAVLLSQLAAEHGRFVVFDLHSYNHRRDGPEAAAADPAANPEINLGTRSLDRAGWAPVVDAFLAAMRGFGAGGRRFTVGENVRFGGGELARWVHRRFADTGCVLAIEVKKVFMDEWTGEPDPAEIDRVGRALAAAVPPVLTALSSVATGATAVTAVAEGRG